jgi:type VI protein secretion system component VasK
MTPRRKFERGMAALTVLTLAALVLLYRERHRIADWAFGLPSVVVWAIPAGWLLLCLLASGLFFAAGDADRAVENRRDSLKGADERAAQDATRSQRNVVALPQRKPDGVKHRGGGFTG